MLGLARLISVAEKLLVGGEAFDLVLLQKLFDPLLHQVLRGAMGLLGHEPDDAEFGFACVTITLVGLLQMRIGESDAADTDRSIRRSEEHTSELQSLMRISHAVFCL